MSAKNQDNKRRWRSKTVAFRVSPEEAYKIDMMATTVGLTKQDFIIKRLENKDIIVHPNCRIKRILSKYLIEMTDELKRLQRIEQDDDIIENIRYIIELITQMNENYIKEEK